MTPTTQPSGGADFDRQREVQVEQSATIISYLLRLTQSGSAEWELSADKKRFATCIDEKRIVINRKSPYVILHKKGDGSLDVLFPARVAHQLQGELKDLCSAIEFRADAPSPAFDDLLRLATAAGSDDV